LEVGKMLAAKLGKERRVDDLGPDDFHALRVHMAKRWGPVALSNRIGVVSSIFKWADKEGLLESPVRFGAGFTRPSKKTIEQAKQAREAEHGKREFSAEQIRALLDAAAPHMRAMILLGINGAMGNADVGNLPQRALDLENGWCDYPRVKPAIRRRIPLWPETVQALQLAIAVRPKPLNPADADLCFIGPRGKNYRKGFRVSAEFLKAASEVGVPGEFYNLRRMFQTIAEGCLDFPAVSAIMGHAPKSGDMSSVYRQSISDERLLAVTSFMRSWLWAAEKSGPQKKKVAAVEPLRIVG
jgi:integrase